MRLLEDQHKTKLAQISSEEVQRQKLIKQLPTYLAWTNSTRAQARFTPSMTDQQRQLLHNPQKVKTAQNLKNLASQTKKQYQKLEQPLISTTSLDSFNSVDTSAQSPKESNLLDSSHYLKQMFSGYDPRKRNNSQQSRRKSIVSTAEREYSECTFLPDLSQSKNSISTISSKISKDSKTSHPKRRNISVYVSSSAWA